MIGISKPVADSSAVMYRFTFSTLYVTWRGGAEGGRDKEGGGGKGKRGVGQTELRETPTIIDKSLYLHKNKDSRLSFHTPRFLLQTFSLLEEQVCTNNPDPICADL